jgi:hypothetical protein
VFKLFLSKSSDFFGFHMRFWVIVVENGFMGFDCHLFVKRGFRTFGIKLSSFNFFFKKNIKFKFSEVSKINALLISD